MPTFKEVLKPQDLETLRLILKVYGETYIYLNHKKISTLEQLLDICTSGEITFEDIFLAHVDKMFQNDIGGTADYYWEDHMEVFDVENYFPSVVGKEVGNGQWIKIRTPVGYEIHYARVARRKHRYVEEYNKVSNKLTSLLKKELTELQNSIKQEEKTVGLSKVKKDVQKSLSDKKLELQVRHLIGIPVYEVRIQRSKSRVEYYLPYQYEIVQDVEEITQYYLNKVTGVSIKSIYTAENYDKIHYLMSRGINRRTAEIMATLNQSYFIVNMQEAMGEYNKQFSLSLKPLLESNV